MKVFVNTHLKGVYLNAVCVAFADTKDEAVQQMEAECFTAGLEQKVDPAKVIELTDYGVPRASMLWNGDY